MLARSVMEGATYALKDSLEIMAGMGIKPKEIRLSGGGARSPFWGQMQADIYDCNCAVTNSFVGPAYGVMLLAGVGAGVWKDVPQACKATIKVEKRIKKKAAGVKTYARHYPVYRDLYHSLKDDFAKIAEVSGD
jgi:xylulokinase